MNIERIIEDKFNNDFKNVYRNCEDMQSEYRLSSVKQIALKMYTTAYISQQVKIHELEAQLNVAEQLYGVCIRPEHLNAQDDILNYLSRINNLELQIKSFEETIELMQIIIVTEKLKG